jgi:hypothetical protein
MFRRTRATESRSWTDLLVLLQERYERELRPNLIARETWHDGTLKMWLGAYFSRTDSDQD